MTVLITMWGASPGGGQVDAVCQPVLPAQGSGVEDGERLSVMTPEGRARHPARASLAGVLRHDGHRVRLDERTALSADPEPTPATAAVECLQAEVDRLRTENRQLRQAIPAHTVIDQAIGVLTTLGQITPHDGFAVLREVSQHTNIKLSQVAEEILKHAQGAPLPEVLLGELHTSSPDTPSASGRRR